MEIFRLPALSDNYIFLLYDAASHTAAVVDPAEPFPVLRRLKELNACLTAIFNTHHHGDHVGANQDLQQTFPEITIYGGDRDRGRIPGQQVFLQEGDRVTFAGHTAEVLFIPGHTRAHIAYYFPASGDLFCGDTLFAGSCGRLFEGTPLQMSQSLQRLSQLPEATRVWCAHEYTLSNLKFALTVDASNAELRERAATVAAMRQRGEATIPSTIALEKATNPFLRCDRPEIQRRLGTVDLVSTFAKMRAMKDIF